MRSQIESTQVIPRKNHKDAANDARVCLLSYYTKSLKLNMYLSAILELLLKEILTIEEQKVESKSTNFDFNVNHCNILSSTSTKYLWF